MQTASSIRHSLCCLGLFLCLPLAVLSQSDSLRIAALLDSARLTADTTFFVQALEFAAGEGPIGDVEYAWAQFARRSGMGDAAHLHYEAAIRAYGAAGREAARAEALRNQGINFFFRGMTSEAFDKLFEAGDAMEAAKDSAGLAWVYRNIGSIYNQIGQDRKAVDYHLQALYLSRKTGDRPSEADTWNNLGNAWMDLKEFGKSVRAYGQARQLFKAMDRKDGVALIDMNLGVLLTKTGNFELSLKFLDKSRRENEALNNVSGLVKVYAAIGHAHNQLGHPEEVILNSGKALKLAGDQADPFNLVGIYMDLADAYAQQGNYEKAYEFQEKWTIQNNHIHNADITEQISLTESRYREEKASQELRIRELEAGKAEGQRNLFFGIAFFLFLTTILGALLVRNNRQKNRILEEKRQLSEQALVEKETLLREIHHRVKNNLQVISSILNLQTRYVEDEAAVAAMREGRNRVKAMALIHQELYQLDELAGVDIREYLGNLTHGLLKSWEGAASRINVDLKVEGLLVDIDTALPLALVVNELVSNSLKHAFPDERKGTIFVRLRQEGDLLLLEVGDDGIGIPESVDFDPKSSFGMKLISILARKLKAEPGIIRSPHSLVRLRIHQYQLKNKP